MSWIENLLDDLIGRENRKLIMGLVLLFVLFIGILIVLVFNEWFTKQLK